MSNLTAKPSRDILGKTPEPIIGPHGGYRGLKAFQLTEIIYDATVKFTGLYIDRKSRTVDQMVQAARSGRQNIAEGSRASGTSKKSELKLINVARASLEELLLDYEDFLRQRNLEQWPKEHEKAVFIRRRRHQPEAPYDTYKLYVESKGAGNAANTMIVLIHQANYLLDQLIRRLDQEFAENGGFTEKLYRVRTQNRGKPESDRSDKSD
jgi:restriction system protein